LGLAPLCVQVSDTSRNNIGEELMRHNPTPDNRGERSNKSHAHTRRKTRNGRGVMDKGLQTLRSSLPRMLITSVSCVYVDPRRGIGVPLTGTISAPSVTRRWAALSVGCVLPLAVARSRRLLSLEDRETRNVPKRSAKVLKRKHYRGFTGYQEHWAMDVATQQRRCMSVAFTSEQR